MVGMPAIIGAIDGTLVKIQEVGGAQNKTDFFCCKQFYAINMQIVCDANAVIQDIVARWPGSTHDEVVFLNYNIFDRFLNGEFRRNGRESLLLRDGGYGSEIFLAVPLRATNRPTSRVENMYQRAHISTRIYLETVLNVTVATAVLHNMCKFHGDNTPPMLSPYEEAQYQTALRIENDIILNNQHQQQRRRPANSIINQMLRNVFEQLA